MAKKSKVQAPKLPPKPKPLTPSEKKTLGRILAKARAARSYNAAIARKADAKK